jgi:hypothetical protein
VVSFPSTLTRWLLAIKRLRAARSARVSKDARPDQHVIQPEET